MNKLFHHKKANLPVTILVIGIFLVCTLAIFIFYSSNQNMKKAFDDVFIIEKIKLEKEKLDFYNKEKIDFEGEVSQIFDIKEDSVGRKYLSEKQGAIIVKYYLD